MTTLPVATFTTTFDDLVILMTLPLPTGGSVSVDWYCFAGGAANAVEVSTARAIAANTALRMGVGMGRYLRVRMVRLRPRTRTSALPRGASPGQCGTLPLPYRHTAPRTAGQPIRVALAYGPELDDRQAVAARD